ncbi:hypothetical protein [Carboxydothermus ferrireducens]|uniref:Uncharacterized protein n=1 Tax=Carboxydothermus ferrireducens DSM 11255 TaxID=1119529 RepID=A0ABX2RB49_9THEO|nr:hypothetical protein [Carboxydothermus ferrireducens]NYE58397.1 hypothetical protein [Carboxydothermus ferrireducens DSM 11255]
MPRKKATKITEESANINISETQKNKNTANNANNISRKTAKHYIIELLKEAPEQTIKMTLEKITELINQKIALEGRDYKYQRPNIWSAIQKLAENGVIKIKKGKNRRDPNTIILLQPDVDFNKISSKRSPGRPEQKVLIAKKQYNLLKNQLKKTEKQFLKILNNLKDIKETLELMENKNKKAPEEKGARKRGRPKKV